MDQNRSPGNVRTDQSELTEVRHEHEAVPGRYRLTWSRTVAQSMSSSGAFTSDDPAFGHLTLVRTASLDLCRDVQAEVRMPGALVGELPDAEHLRLEHSPTAPRRFASGP